MNFEEADKVEHPVEGEWHYKHLVSAGFVPVTKTATGLVRCYKYEHPDGRTVQCNTGASSDYWTAADARGYWRDLAAWAAKTA